MVLRPLVAPVANKVETPTENKPLPAWSAVSERQKCRAEGYWLVTQPDHAALSGDLAANFVSKCFPRVDSLVARAIGVHDAGWSMYPEETSPLQPPLLTAEGKPLAFVEFAPHEFLRAWTGSIERAEGVCPAGGVIVSRHFCELGRFRMENDSRLSEHDRELIRAFSRREVQRQQRLSAHCSYAAPELEALLKVLQFCDLLSLYLCSGAEEEAEFPEGLARQPVRISRPQERNFFQLDPSPFQANGNLRLLNLGVNARYYPSNGEPRLTRLEFLVR